MGENEKIKCTVQGKCGISIFWRRSRIMTLLYSARKVLNEK